MSFLIEVLKIIAAMLNAGASLRAVYEFLRRHRGEWQQTHQVRQDDAIALTLNVEFSTYTPICSMQQRPEDHTGDHNGRNPIPAAILAAVGLAAVLNPGAVAIAILSALGFSAAGPVLGMPYLCMPLTSVGSVAAAVQSSLGVVGAGGWFATLQSAGMAGYGVAAVDGVVQVVGGTVMAIGAWLFGR